MGSNFSKLKEKKNEETSIVSSSNSSGKSLLYKIQTTLQHDRFSKDNSEKTNDYTESSINKKNRRLFKRKSNTVDQDESYASSDEDLVSKPNSPVISATARVSAYSENEQHSFSQSSIDPVLSHNLAPSVHSASVEDNQDLTPSANSSRPTSNLENSILPNESHRRIKSWLESLSSPKNNLAILQQNIASSIFLRTDNGPAQRKEKDRQQRLHYLLKRIWNGLYRAKLDDPKVIVNWCCGIGLWDMEMASLFPESHVVGIDFKEATLSNLQYSRPNLEFRHVVIHDHYTGLESFESDSVDYIMMRDIWFINAPVSKWDVVLEDAFRILKPGGWIELSEHSLSIQSPGPCTRKLDTYYQIFFSEIGIDKDIEFKLGRFLTKSGFTHVDQEEIAIPLGEWPASDGLKETGYLLKDWAVRSMRGLSKWVCDINHVEPSEMNRLITLSMDKEIDEYHSYISWTSYTAQKPSTNYTESPQHSDDPVSI